MKVDYIKTKTQIFKNQKSGVKDKSKYFGNLPVCNIKELTLGRFQIDYFCSIHQCYVLKKGLSIGDEDKPNKRIILYPNTIEEVHYII